MRSGSESFLSTNKSGVRLNVCRVFDVQRVEVKEVKDVKEVKEEVENVSVV